MSPFTIHGQDESVPGWDAAAAKFPNYSVFKFVDNVSAIGVAARTAAANGKKMMGVFRKHADDMQQFPGDWNTLVLRAKQYIGRFLNDSFRAQAEHIFAVEYFNETLAVSQSWEEQMQILRNYEAFCYVWNGEVRKEAGLDHISPALPAAAVGNDIPVPFWKLAVDEDAFITYHNYVAVYWPEGAERAPLAAFERRTLEEEYRASFRHPTYPGQPYQVPYLSRSYASLEATTEGGYELHGAWTFPAVFPRGMEISPEPGMPSPGEWDWASGRWTHMDALARQNGHKVKGIILTEGGPIRDYNGAGWLDPLGGWRLCCGSIDKYLEIMRYYADKVQAWNDANDDRAYPSQLYTLSSDPTWRHFNHTAGDIERLAELANQYPARTSIWPKPVEPDPGPDPEPPPSEEKCHAREPYSRTYILMPPDVPARWAVAAMDAGWDKRRWTVGGSADDAGIGCGLKRRRAVVINPGDWGDDISAWFRENYAGTEVIEVQCANEAEVYEKLREMVLAGTL